MSRNTPTSAPARRGEMDDETKKASAALSEHQKKQETKVFANEDGQTKSLAEGFTRKATVFLKNNKNGKYTVDGACTKILIESCKDCEITLNGRINTEMVELWRCDNITLVMNTKVKTLQVDLANHITARFTEKTNFSQIIWAGVHNFDITIGSDSLKTGVELVNTEEIEDFKENFDQFIVRYLKNRLVEELVVRLDNGFPTTEREASAFDEQKEKNDKLYEAHVRKLISTKTSGISDKLDLLSKKEIKKVGRNDPCPCGSSKKYKKCCEGKTGLTEEQQQQINAAKEALAAEEEKKKQQTAELAKLADKVTHEIGRAHV